MHSTLLEQWDLDSLETNHRLFGLSKYKPLYILFANYTSDINQQPESAALNHHVDEPIALNSTELKFQLSFKTKVLHNLLGLKLGGDIWLGYTQTSRWQVYNAELSRPFRETNYEPEIMFILPTRYKLFGLEGVFVGVGLNHQSNGRSNPYSRSWNRIIAQVACETKTTSIVFRPWWRIQESAEIDDNPGIENYMGRGELLFAYGKGRHNLSIIGRHSFRLGDEFRGGVQLDYDIQVFDFLRFHTQVFHGFGESMIDFNHKQTTVGVGFSLTEWR